MEIPGLMVVDVNTQEQSSIAGWVGQIGMTSLLPWTPQFVFFGASNLKILRIETFQVSRSAVIFTRIIVVNCPRSRISEIIFPRAILIPTARLILANHQLLSAFPVDASS